MSFLTIHVAILLTTAVLGYGPPPSTNDIPTNGGNNGCGGSSCGGLNNGGHSGAAGGFNTQFPSGGNPGGANGILSGSFPSGGSHVANVIATGGFNSQHPSGGNQVTNGGTPGGFNPKRPSGGSPGTKGGPYWWQGSNSPFKGQVGCGPGSPGCSTGNQGGSLPFTGSAPSVSSSSGSFGNQAPAGNFNFQLPSVIQPDNIQQFVQPQMGNCQENDMCVHWQLCKGGNIIYDSSSLIDKRVNAIPNSIASKYKSCGADMICCSIPAEGSTLLQGITRPGSFPTQQTSSSIHSSVASQLQPGSPNFASSPSKQTPGFSGSHSLSLGNGAQNGNPQKKPQGSSFSGNIPGSPISQESPGFANAPHDSNSQGFSSNPGGHSSILGSPGIPLPVANHSPISQRPSYSSNPGYGSTGSTGILGSSGSPDNQGFPNNPSLVGFPSSSGTPIFSGNPGSPGHSGNPGSPGHSGNSGLPGHSGNPGSPGFSGHPGSPGAGGNPSYQGSPGSGGNLGFSGSPGNSVSNGFPGNLGAGTSHGISGSPGNGGNHGFPGNNPGFSGNIGSPSFGSSQNAPAFPQQPGVNMAGMMMMPMGMPLLGGTCSAGTYCVQINQCNPYNGFIIRDPSQIAAVWPDSPQVPLLPCFVPGGGIQNGVCCQESHPIIGANGMAFD